MSILIEQNNNLYKAQYYVDDNQVIVLGSRGEEAIDIHGMKVEQAARMGLRNLIRKNLIDPLEKSSE